MEFFHETFFKDSNSACYRMVDWWIGDFCIEKVTLLPTCVLAVIVAIITGIKILRVKKKFDSKWAYAITFFAFGFMMSAAGITHCIIGDEPKQGEPIWMPAVRIAVTALDVSLTSNIGIGFLFCGLIDVNWIDGKSKRTKIIFGLIWVLVYPIWFVGLTIHSKYIFFTMYIFVVGFGCSTFLITQIFYFIMYKIKLTRRAKWSLFFGALFGGFGYACVLPNVNETICVMEGVLSMYISPIFIWFLFSDFAMYFVAVFIANTRVNEEEKDNSIC